jgi:hypothetical protein
MTGNHPPSPPTLPFGRYRGVALGDVPTSYLAWALANLKLSSGLRAALADELTSRGVTPPPAPPPRPLPSCPGCPLGTALAHWQEDRLGRRRIKVSCWRCGRGLGFLPEVEPYIGQADANTTPTAVLDVLIELDRLGVGLISDGRAVDFGGDGWQRVPPELRRTVDQVRHQLAKLIGKTTMGGTDPMARWTGWIRRNGRSRWELVAEGETLDECARRLSEWGRRHGVTLANTNEAITAGAPPVIRKERKTR